MSSEHPTPSTPGQFWFRTPVVWITIPLLGLIAAYCWRLWPEWSRNPDLTHGFATPLICAMLISESCRHGTQRWLPGNGGWSLLPAIAIGAAVVFFALAGLIAASLGWDNVLVEFLLSLTLAAALLSGLFCLSSARMSALPLNWISLTAAGIWILSAPLPSGTYARLTLELQGWVTNGVIAVLQLIGIPARQHGNIIELTRTTVGVEEACSGIRSLLSCTYASFFFAAWQVRSAAGRALLIIIAPILALGMNLLRSLALTLMANAGVEISGFWHDATGFSILGLTAVILAILASKLGPRQASEDGAHCPQCAGSETDEPKRVEVNSLHPASTENNWGNRTFGLGVGAIVFLAAVFAFYGRPVPPPAIPAHDPASLLPATADGWDVTTAKDLEKFSGILRTTQLVERTYIKTNPGQPVMFSVYLARWAPGQAPVSLVASHTPDACWPGAGWLPQTNPTPQIILTLGSRPLPRAEYRIFQSTNSPPREVWYWHVYNGRVINYRDPYSVPALLELALRYGFRREGEQYFIRITSNRPWDEIAREPLLAEIIAQLTPIGLIP